MQQHGVHCSRGLLPVVVVRVRLAGSAILADYGEWDSRFVVYGRHAWLGMVGSLWSAPAWDGRPMPGLAAGATALLALSPIRPFWVP